MQTFLPYPDYIRTAQVLDRQRLGKQRVEAKQILNALLGLTSGWVNHPAVKMWRGYEGSLALYGWSMCIEWVHRGYNDTLTPWFEQHVDDYVGHYNDPPWLGKRDFHRSHKSNLIRKMPEHYRAFWPHVPDDLPYVWPTPLVSLRRTP